MKKILFASLILLGSCTETSTTEVVVPTVDSTSVDSLQVVDTTSVVTDTVK